MPHGSMRVDTSGLNLQALARRVTEAIPSALEDGAEHIKSVAVEQAPIETGHLRESAAVSLGVGHDRAYITFDGPYAAYQHERLDLKHKTGHAKFLELAVSSERIEALKIVASRLHKALWGLR